MDENARMKLSDALSNITKKKIDINFSTNKDLIGGLKIKIDDMLFDSSLKTKLENAKSKLIGV
jgi:F0F1-type ATP synthase delta subunit